MRLVAGEECLVREQKHAIPEVGVEVANEVLGVRDFQRVLPHDPAQRICQCALSASFNTFHDDCNFRALFRKLHHPGRPVYHVVIVSAVPGTDYTQDVLLQLLP